MRPRLEPIHCTRNKQNNKEQGGSYRSENGETLLYGTADESCYSFVLFPFSILRSQHKKKGATTEKKKKSKGKRGKRCPLIKRLQSVVSYEHILYVLLQHANKKKDPSRYLRYSCISNLPVPARYLSTTVAAVTNPFIVVQRFPPNSYEGHILARESIICKKWQNCLPSFPRLTPKTNQNARNSGRI